MLPGHATNYLTNGLTWIVEAYGTQSPYPESDIVQFFLDGYAVVNGRSCSKLWMARNGDLSTKVLQAFLYEEDGKVFFICDDNDSAGTLMYDFNLSENETTCVGLLPSETDKGQQIKRAYMKCTGRSQMTIGENAFEVMHMEEYADAEYSLSIGKGDWIVGIASEYGICRNGGFGLDGSYSRLVKVTLGDNVIYEREITGVSCPSATGKESSNGKKYKLDGTISTASDNGIYIFNGKKYIKKQ